MDSLRGPMCVYVSSVAHVGIFGFCHCTAGSTKRNTLHVLHLLSTMVVGFGICDDGVIKLVSGALAPGSCSTMFGPPITTSQGFGVSLPFPTKRVCGFCIAIGL